MTDRLLDLSQEIPSDRTVIQVRRVAARRGSGPVRRIWICPGARKAFRGA